MVKIDFESSVIDDLVSVRDWIRWSATQFERGEVFYGHGTDNPWDEAAQLVLWVIRTPWEKLEHILDTRLTHQERQQILDGVDKRINQRLPLPYVTGIAHFAGLEFEVTRDTLIPRSPISELIERRFQPWLGEEPCRILDLCTGCGCIGIACAAYFESAHLVLSDLSVSALTVAKRNIQRYSLASRVEAVESDLFEQISGQFDLIVSNPPYVDADDLASMPVEFQAEPQLALASGADGLDFTRRLLSQAHHYLTENGLLIVEVGNSAEALEASYPGVPFVWLEFERGGHGVFSLSKAQLLAHSDQFQAAVQ